MGPRMRAAVLIPALDEESTIESVVGAVRALDVAEGGFQVDELLVVDNGSTDQTAARARAAGATVRREERRGYGQACLTGLEYYRGRTPGPPDILVFLDADGSCVVSEMVRLVEPIVAGAAELVIGSRVRLADRGSLSIPQRFGNRLATGLLRVLYGAHSTDLGPFRAVRWPALERMQMSDPDYGWTVEMQVKAAKLGIPVREVDVHYLPRAGGKSKITGTLRGVAGAGTKIIWTLVQNRG